MDLILERDALLQLAMRHHDRYVSNEPFPHIVIDDFLTHSVAEAIVARFPSPRSLPWKRYDNEMEVKLEFRDETRLDGYLRDVLYQLNSALFLEFLEVLTGAQGLISDPYFEGGGIHQIERGGFLNIHADFNYHSKLGLRRRRNVLLYFNKDWKDEYKGHLELWDAQMRTCVQRIAPRFNRCVVFNTDDFAYHGHPEPLQCPAGMTRKSLALYYYSSDVRAEAEGGGHSTLFRVRPGEAPNLKYSRLRRLRRRVKETVLQFVPPIGLTLYERLRSHR
jgi:Rps23 Pro-64 3,4-dihydroxylase Tpa1-like proline 4-hydroxylase